MKEKLDIVACTDKSFVMPTGVMMLSVCVNNPETDIVFHIILEDNVKAGDRQSLEDIVSPYNGKSIVFYYANDEIQKMTFPEGEKLDITKVAYYRLFLADLLPKEIEKVLYLDGDLIVRHSLLPLWEIDLGEHAIAAAHDGSSGVIEFYNRLKYPFELGYFNSGVMLINLDYWRRNGIGKQLADCLKDNPEKIKQGDQDALNCVLCESKLELPSKYNFQSSYLYTYCFNEAITETEVREAVEDPVIVHFISEKPWNKYIRELHPYRSTFFKYQNETKWKGMRTERRTMRMKVVNAIADLLRFLKLKAPLKESFVNIKSID